jgi:cytochrome P450
MHYIHALHQTYGPIVRIAPAEIAVADFDSFREIHRIKSGYLKSRWYQKFTNHESPGIFAMIDPQQHAKRRQLLARGFSKSYLRHNWEYMAKEKAKLAVAKIRRDAEKATADILKWWTFYTTDTIAQLSFGESFHMLEQEEVCVFHCFCPTSFTWFTKCLNSEKHLYPYSRVSSFHERNRD